MFRNQYDTDVTTWSPVGRLYQVEYAMEAVKQGSAAVGLRGADHAVLATLKRAASTLSSYQRKIFTIDDHVGIAIAGLNADGRVLSRFMRSECLNHRFVYESPLPVGRLVGMVADKSQVCTQRSWKRPYGVGLLVAGYDSTGPHLFQTCPSGNFWEFHAMAIGSRSQAAKTYLERQFEKFASCSLDELLVHALSAVKESLQEGELTGLNCSLAVVGKDHKFRILDDDEVQAYINNMESVDSRAPPGDEAAEPAPEAAATEGGAEAAAAALEEGADIAPGGAAAGAPAREGGADDEPAPMQE